MSGLSRPQAVDRLRLLATTPEFPYEAGEMEGKPFPAGVSRRICVQSLDLETFYVMKLKTAEVARLAPLLDQLGQGVEVTVTHSSYRGQYTCHDLAATHELVGTVKSGRG